jgi:hypothetical protein
MQGRAKALYEQSKRKDVHRRTYTEFTASPEQPEGVCMLKEVIIAIAIAIGGLCVLATLAFLVLSLLPSPSVRQLLKRWQPR